MDDETWMVDGEWWTVDDRMVDLMTFGDSINRLEDGRVGTSGAWKTDKWTITRAEGING